MCLHCLHVLQREVAAYFIPSQLKNDFVSPTGQLEVETRQSHPANPSHTVPLIQSQRHPISIPPHFHFMSTPVGRRGLLCVAGNCSMFGDPKQAGMCTTHYREHLASISNATHSAPIASQRNEASINIPYASQVHITPTSTTIITPALNRELASGTAETAPSAFFRGSQVSVPPPSIPVLESGFRGGTRVQGPSLGETYERVAGHHAKCLNPACTNYGNSSKGGLCNSCARNPVYSDEWLGRMIYGDEQTG